MNALRPADTDGVGWTHTVDVADADDRPPVGGRWITLLVLAVLGVNIAFVTPMVISLAIRVEDLAPAHENYLGFILGIGSAVTLLVGPLGGQLSDRTRSRVGRRTPWVVGGLLVGMVGLMIVALAPTVSALGAGWVLALLGFSQVVGNLSTIQADRLPRHQRGTVAGLAATASMVAPVLGVLVTTSMAEQPVALMMAPAAIALVLVSLFVPFIGEEDNRDVTFPDGLSARVVLSKYVFDPRQYPDFFWNWLGRMSFFFGIALATTYTAYFVASRLGQSVAQVGGAVAIIGVIGLAGLAGGALSSGFVSDKIARRKPFILGGGVLFAAGALAMAAATDLPQIVAGSFLCNLGIGMFTATDQALLLDVLPGKGTEAGRFMAIASLATTIPQALAPVSAAALLSIGAGSSAAKNYPLVYFTAGGLAVLGGLIIQKTKSVR